MKTSSCETKVVMQDIASKYKVVKNVDKKNLEWNTEFIEAMELEHVMSQAAQDLNDSETRNESRKLKLTNTNIYLNAKRCSGRNTRTPVSDGERDRMAQKLLEQYGEFKFPLRKGEFNFLQGELKRNGKHALQRDRHFANNDLQPHNGSL